jgi:hypothetical protein
LKTVKRIIAVLLLIVTVALVGYLVFTGSQLTLYDMGGVYEENTGI